jgi:hypothetical protein
MPEMEMLSQLMGYCYVMEKFFADFSILRNYGYTVKEEGWIEKMFHVYIIRRLGGKIYCHK